MSHIALRRSPGAFLIVLKRVPLWKVAPSFQFVTTFSEQLGGTSSGPSGHWLHSRPDPSGGVACKIRCSQNKKKARPLGASLSLTLINQYQDDSVVVSEGLPMSADSCEQYDPVCPPFCYRSSNLRHTTLSQSLGHNHIRRGEHREQSDSGRLSKNEIRELRLPKDLRNQPQPDTV